MKPRNDDKKHSPHDQEQHKPEALKNLDEKSLDRSQPDPSEDKSKTRNYHEDMQVRPESLDNPPNFQPGDNSPGQRSGEAGEEKPDLLH